MILIHKQFSLRNAVKWRMPKQASCVLLHPLERPALGATGYLVPSDTKWVSLGAQILPMRLWEGTHPTRFDARTWARQLEGTGEGRTLHEVLLRGNTSHFTQDLFSISLLCPPALPTQLRLF